MNTRIDYPLLVVTLILVIAGVLVVFSASVVISDRNFGNIYHYSLRHILYAAAGLVVLFFASSIPYKVWRKLALPLMFIALVMLAAVFLPKIGFRHGGAVRWIDLGLFSFQPSEFLKIAMIFYLAGWLSRKNQEDKDIYGAFLPFVVILAVISIFLFLQPDIGTLVVVVFAATILYFLGGGKIYQMGALGLLGIVGMYITVLVAPYRLARFVVFWDPGIDPGGLSYHLNQALIAIGSGGFFGRGFGQSLQKYSYLPEPIGDSIFAIYIEELGFVGAIILISLFGVFVWRGLLIARKAPDVFSKLVAAGITSSIAFQAFINMGAISGLLPLTGVPLPFISYGGTALITTLFSTGVLLNISRHT